MTKTMSEEERIRFATEIESLKITLITVLHFYKINLRLFNGIKTANYSQYFLEIVARFRYNSEGLLNLLDSFEKDYRLKICLNLLLRSICSDCLTALYLYTFYDKNDKENIAIKNELDLISSEYLRYLKQTTEEDYELTKSLKLPMTETIEERRNWVNSLAPELLDKQGKIKGREEIRQTSAINIKEGLKKSGSFLTENEKYQRIKEKGFAQYGFIFLAFKYYSQFQHFSLMSKKIIESKPFHDTLYMAMTIDHMLITTDIIFQIAKSPNQNFKSEIRILREDIAKHFGSSSKP